MKIAIASGKGECAGAIPIGRIPYDSAVTAAQINARTLIEESDGPASREVRKIWEMLCSTI